MCDLEKYNKIYKEMKELQMDETLQLVLEADTEEESEFYELVGNFFFQKRQKEVVEANKF